MIPVHLNDVITILSETPSAVKHLVGKLDVHWLNAREGPDTWSPYEVVAHLVFGEQTDWVARMQIILGDQENKTFTPFDRSGHFALARDCSIESLLHKFEHLRQENLRIVSSAAIKEVDLDKTGIHPAFGPVTLRQLLAAWVVHDMTHIYQISRIIAKQYELAVGPWKEYMGILNR